MSVAPTGAGPDATSLYLLTGASRGMGAAIAARLLQPENTLLCLSRRPDPALAARAEAARVRCEQWALDLVDASVAASKIEDWLAAFEPGQVGSATLINNAALLPQIGPLGDLGATDLSAALRVGLEAPLLLTAAFLRATRHWPVPKRVLNISSGLGRRAMAAQAPYCAAKAGLDHFSRCVALEEAGRAHGARIVSLAPGVIDTDMQGQLRNADPARFPDRGNFIGLKDQGQLATADAAAASVLAYLQRPDFGANPVADVRDA